MKKILACLVRGMYIDIGDYTTQLCGDYHKPYKPSIFSTFATYLEVDPKKIGKRISFGVGGTKGDTHEAPGGNSRGKNCHGEKNDRGLAGTRKYCY